MAAVFAGGADRADQAGAIRSPTDWTLPPPAYQPATLPGVTEADATLARAKEVSSRAIVDLRGIVHGLRPPALDDLGLIGAVRANATKLTDGTGLRVTVEPEDVGELPAAVEVAAFRIAVEAISNVVRHSGPAPARYGSR